jgi:hypothetical protein
VASVLPPDEACRFLVSLSNVRGGPDNITAIIVRASGPTAAAEVAPGRPRRKPLLARAWSLLTRARPPAKAHRRRACQIEPPLVDQVSRALRELFSRA